MPPIYTSSTFIQESPGVHKGFEYSRSHNVTRFALERCLANLESSGLTEEEDRTQGGFAFASGLAAIATCLELLDAGETIMCMDDVYGGTNRLLQRVRQGAHLPEWTPELGRQGMQKIDYPVSE